MKCPFCGSQDTSVLESRIAEDGESLRRRRECNACQRRFTTFERIEGPSLFVIKRDGGREAFERDKIVRGIVRSFAKRPISIDFIHQMVDDIEREIRRKEGSEISSKIIGRMVLKKLKPVDKIAWLRFASVYMDLSDISEFEKLIEQIHT